MLPVDHNGTGFAGGSRGWVPIRPNLDERSPIAHASQSRFQAREDAWYKYNSIKYHLGVRCSHLVTRKYQACWGSFFNHTAMMVIIYLAIDWHNSHEFKVMTIPCDTSPRKTNVRPVFVYTSVYTNLEQEEDEFPETGQSDTHANTTRSTGTSSSFRPLN